MRKINRSLSVLSDFSFDSVYSVSSAHAADFKREVIYQSSSIASLTQHREQQSITEFWPLMIRPKRIASLLGRGPGRHSTEDVYLAGMG